MARSPFQGTWRPGVRPTVVTAPDALVYINGESDLIGCPQCSRKFDLNKYITSIQVDLNIDSPPGSASISMSVPRHSIDDLYFDGNLLLTPMMEVEIYAKGYFLVEGVPQYYPIFWGMTTEVNESYSGGEHTISISCNDILKWWELCKMNINPAFTQAVGQGGRNIFGNVFFGTNPYDVIWTLAQQSFGDVVVGSGSLNSTFKEPQQKETFSSALASIQMYWQRRFSRIRSNLLLYGTNGTAVRGDVLWDQYRVGGRKQPNTEHFASAAVKKANGGANSGQMIFDATDPAVVAFRTQGTQAGQINFWQSEYQTKLELATAAKDAIGFEFFMDVDGSIVFKPPFFNLDVLPNKPVSWIQDIDVIDWDFSESEAEVVTQIQLQGNFTGNIDWGVGEEATPFTSVTDYHLLQKYGWRAQTYNSEFLGDPQIMFYVGMDMLDRYNARRHRGTVNIPLRPELRMGFPVYIASRDQYWYIQGISHNIAFGGRAQTTLTLTAKRQKFIAPKGVGTLTLTNQPATTPNAPTSDLQSKQLSGRELTSTGAFELTVGALFPPVMPTQKQAQSGDDPYAPVILRHPKTGRILGYPNLVMAYTRPFANIPIGELNQIAGSNPQEAAKRAAQQRDEFNKSGQEQVSNVEESMHTYQPTDAIRDEHLSSRYTYGLTSAGAYTYCYDKSKTIQEIILPPRSRVTVKSVDPGQKPSLGADRGAAMIRPVSDERGFEVIGHFRYGRGVHLRDGSLILNEDQPNSAASIGAQVAISTASGGLFESLAAQSQGITVVTATGNKATTLATLQPEELQTAGRINPDTGTPEFTNGTDGKNLIVSSAPLGSLAQQGLPASVEASQLSRALTLAEMTVKEGSSTSDECICLLGRSDLAFINTGYQVKTLFNTNVPGDHSGLPATGNAGYTTEFGLASQQTLELRRKIANTVTAAVEAKTASEQARLIKEAQDQLALLEADPYYQTIDPDGLKKIAQAKAILNSANFQEGITNAANQAGLQAGLQALKDTAGISLAEFNQEGEISAALTDNRPVKGAVAPSGQDLQFRVEQYLVNLYRALDADHQTFEQGLRGELIPQGNLDPNAVRFGNGFDPQQLPAYAPPFNAPNRALGGDPAAIAMSGSSAVGDLKKSWDNFGKKLKANTERAGLEQQIRNDQADIARLQEQKAHAEAFLSRSDNKQVFFGDPNKIISDCDKEIARLQNDIANKQQQANLLPT